MGDFLIANPGASVSLILEIVTQTYSLRLKLAVPPLQTKKVWPPTLFRYGGQWESWFFEGNYFNLKLRAIKSV